MMRLMDIETTPNFQSLICDLVSVGLSITEIAEMTGSSQPGITRLKNGVAREPRYTLGLKLVRLHSEEMIRLRKAQRLKRLKKASTKRKQRRKVKKEKAGSHCAS